MLTQNPGALNQSCDNNCEFFFVYELYQLLQINEAVSCHIDNGCSDVGDDGRECKLSYTVESLPHSNILRCGSGDLNEPSMATLKFKHILLEVRLLLRAIVRVMDPLFLWRKTHCNYLLGA